MRTIHQIETHAERFYVRATIAEAERARRQELERKPAPNDGRLLKPTRCKTLKLFCISGKQVQVGEIVTLDLDTARSLAAIGKVAIET